MQYYKQTQKDMIRMITFWKQSGLSQKAYCQQNNIRYHVFHYWYKWWRDQQDRVRADTFIPLDVKPSPADNCSCGIEILFPDGRRILFHQPVSSDFLKALIS
jgi:hypothetical protein